MVFERVRRPKSEDPKDAIGLLVDEKFKEFATDVNLMINNFQIEIIR